MTRNRINQRETFLSLESTGDTQLIIPIERLLLVADSKWSGQFSEELFGFQMMLMQIVSFKLHRKNRKTENTLRSYWQPQIILPHRGRGTGGYLCDFNVNFNGRPSKITISHLLPLYDLLFNSRVSHNFMTLRICELVHR